MAPPKTCCSRFSTSGGWGGGAELTRLSLPVMLNVRMPPFGVTDYTGPQFTLHIRRGDGGKPRADKAIAAAQ